MDSLGVGDDFGEGAGNRRSGNVVKRLDYYDPQELRGDSRNSERFRRRDWSRLRFVCVDKSKRGRRLRKSKKGYELAERKRGRARGKEEKSEPGTKRFGRVRNQ